MSTNKNVLIIDNDPAIVRAMSRRIESMGLNVLTASSGSQGLALYSQGGVDLIITDVNMPCGDGIELANAVRRIADTPIIFITGFKDEFKKRLRSVSNVTVIRKPFATESFIELIEIELGLVGSTPRNLPDVNPETKDVP